MTDYSQTNCCFAFMFSWHFIFPDFHARHAAIKYFTFKGELNPESNMA